MKDQELRRQMAAKALDMPYDTMGDINVTNVNSLKGIIAGAVVSAGLLGGGGAALFAWQALNSKTENPVKTVIEKQTEVWDYEVEMNVERNP